MIENDDPVFGDGDTEITRLLASLRQVEPTLEGRVDCRLLIARELARRQSSAHQPARAWWRRSISVPVPLAMALSVILMAVFWVKQPQRDASDEVATSAPNHSRDADVRQQEHANAEKPQETKVEVYVSGTYLCGIGQLNTVTRYVTQESGK